jgi:hypothetical protein
MDQNFMVARAPLMKNGDPIPDEGIALQDPYIQENSAIIKPSGDLTVSITTISASLFSKYREFYRADAFGNDHFALLSSSGMGAESSKPGNVKVHHIDTYEKIQANIELAKNAVPDIDTIEAENVIVVEDYQANGKKERLYITFHAFCQNLDRTPLEKLMSAISQVGESTGSKYLGLVPFSLISNIANVANGVNNLFHKITDITHEVKTAKFGFYPATEGKSPDSGDAPLQTGSYIFFFELTDIMGLRLHRDGIVRSQTGKAINPYVVVNIKPEVILAPDQLSTSAAIAVLDSFQSGPSEFSSKQDNAPAQYFDALKALGKSYRLVEQTQRYFILKQKGNSRTPEENAKFDTITKTLKAEFPDWDSVIV